MINKPVFKPLPMLVIFAVTLLASLAFQQPSRADIGPYPDMQFDFIMEADTTLTITEATLLQCSDETCSESEELFIAGLQHFTCSADQCDSDANSYTAYSQLVILFSDNVTRKSNIFGKEFFYANYLVTVRESDLLVEELQSGSDPPPEPRDPKFDAPPAYERFIPPAIVFFPSLIVLINICIGGFQIEKLRQKRWRIAGMWIFIMLLIAIGSLHTSSLPLTIFIEVLVVILYAGIRKRPLLPFLTVVTLANLITQPVVWIIWESFSTGVPIFIHALSEVMVCLIEAAILSRALHKELSFLEALGISVAINTVSVVIGLILSGVLL